MSRLSKRLRQRLGWRVPISARGPYVFVLAAVGALLCVLAAGGAFAARGTSAADPESAQTVTMCHYEGNGSWHLISPSISTVFNNAGHDSHAEDIIPSFTNADPGPNEPTNYAGKHWDAVGQDIFSNGCVKRSPPPTCSAMAAITVAVSPNSVVVTGSGLPPNIVLSFTVSHEKDGAVVASGTVDSGSGDFTSTVWDGTNALEGNAEYTVKITGGGCALEAGFRYDGTKPTPPTKLIVRKEVVGPARPASDFSFRVNGGPETLFEADGENELTLKPGTYGVAEIPVAGFDTSYSGCSDIVIAPAPQDTVPVCTITNTALPAKPLQLRVKKVVLNSNQAPSDFQFVVAGKQTPFEGDGENVVTLPPGTYNVTEPPVTGFDTSYEGCSGIVLAAPQAQAPECTITNTPTEPPPRDVFPIGLSVTCVDRFDDGTFTVTFGYYSPNKLNVDISIGDANRVDPAAPPDGVDRGQPWRFLPGSVAAAFVVTGASGETVTWSITSPAVGPGQPAFEASASATADFAKRCSMPPEEKPPAIAIFLTCVDNQVNTYSATFGFNNPSAAPVKLPVGPQNRFSPPGTEDRGQPISFVPGRVERAFTVDGIANGTNLTWTVNTGNGGPQTATATVGVAQKCSTEPEPTPTPPTDPTPPQPSPPDPSLQPIGVFVQCVTNHGATYDVVFGYQNDNEDTVAIPTGARNRLVPGAAARGQPTDFLPGNVQQAFSVEGIAVGAELTWEVSHGAVTRSTTATAAHPQKCGHVPAAVGPIGIFACIVDRGDTYDAVFGYANDNAVDITIPHGLANHFAPAPGDRSQPTVFNPGRRENAFVVRGLGEDDVLAWTLAYEGVRTAIVTSAYPLRCAGAEPTLPIDIIPFCVRRTGSTYTAVFSYANLQREDVVVPIGDRNRVSPRPIDRGQPSMFQPGIGWYAFAVRAIPVGQDVVWTLTHGGRTDTARASVDLGRLCPTTPVDPGVDVAVEKTAAPSPAAVGDRITYTIVARNLGTTLAQSVTVTDRPLDGRVELLSATASQGRCELRRSGVGPPVTCVLGDLEPGASARIIVAVRATEEGRARNRASAVSLPAEVGANNSATAAVEIRPRSGVAGVSVRPPFTG